MLSRLNVEHRLNTLRLPRLKKKKKNKNVFVKVCLKLKMEKGTESNIKSAATILSLSLGSADK